MGPNSLSVLDYEIVQPGIAAPSRGLLEGIESRDGWPVGPEQWLVSADSAWHLNQRGPPADS